MPVIFPDPRLIDNDEGIVGVGGDLEPDTIINAYSKGIFPWPMPGIPLPWCCPPDRGIIFFDDLKISRSLVRAKNKNEYRFTIDHAFNQVIDLCSKAKRPDGEGTWIIPEMIQAYKKLHLLGVTHSVEAWDETSELVGGLYGVCVEGVFAGESMFYLKPNASKLALLHLIKHLKSRGAAWMDTQMVTPHIQRLGGKSISRNEFLDLLETTQKKKLKLF